MVVDDTTVEDDTPPQVVPPSSGEMAVSPASVASSGHFPFVDSDMVMETSVLDSEFTADVGADGGEGGGHKDTGAGGDRGGRRGGRDGDQLLRFQSVHSCLVEVFF